MAHKKPKKPKFAKYPKRPKGSASLQSWKNYEARCKSVDSRNADKAKVYNKKIADIDSAKKLRESLIRKYSGSRKAHPHLKVA